MLLAICLIVPCFSTIALAAEGIIFFDDLNTKVGDTFEIEGTVVAKGDVLGDASVELTYDSSYIRFIEGEGVTKSGDGKLTFTGQGDGSTDRVKFTMTFQALKQGDTRMNQGLTTVTTKSGETVTCEEGYSDIKIDEGDPSKIQPDGKSKAITIGGEEYTLSEGFDEASLPEGFTVGEMTYDGETYRCAYQETSGLYAAYLEGGENGGEFWLYNAENSSFYPFEEIVISDIYSIVVLDGSKEVKMPAKYVQSNMEINGAEFPVWIEPDREGFYILYAVNNDGQKSLYLYDSQEQTYQRMETPKTAVSSETKKEATSVDKIGEFVSDYLIWVLVGAGCILVILLVLLIVTAVKLRHRNLELDDLYDEYGIDEEPQTETKAQPKKKEQFRKPAAKPVSEETEELADFYDDDFDDDDEYYGDDDFEDDLDDLRKDYTAAAPESKELNFDEYYDDDDFDDFDDEEDFGSLERDRADKKSRKDDTFEMDFIDLD